MDLFLKVEVKPGETQEIELAANRISVGRDVSNKIAIDLNFVSSRHALITRNKDGEYFVEDCDSSNGTFLNDVRLKSDKRFFKDGDRIKFGRIEFTVEKRKSNAIAVVPLRQRRSGDGEITTP